MVCFQKRETLMRKYIKCRIQVSTCAVPIAVVVMRLYTKPAEPLLDGDGGLLLLDEQTPQEATDSSLDGGGSGVIHLVVVMLVTWPAPSQTAAWS